jgi:hypothetical protein
VLLLLCALVLTVVSFNVYWVIILCVFLLPDVYCFTVCVVLSYMLWLPDCWLEVSILRVLRLATLAQVFLGFPMSKSECWDGSQDSQVAIACFSYSPPELNVLGFYFTFMYRHNNHCHRATAHLQLNKILLCPWGVASLPSGTSPGGR